MKYNITEIIQITLALLITGGMLVSAGPIAPKQEDEIEKIEPIEAVEEIIQQVIEPEPIVEVKAPETAPEAVIDPNGCEPKQYWAKEAPYQCIDKPKAVEKSKAVATAPTPAPAPATRSGNCSLVNNYNWPTGIASQICKYESGGNSNAVNWNDRHHNCSGSFSLMQVACFWYPYFGYSSSDHYNSKVNMDIAYKIWQRQGGFSAWTTCKKVPGCR